MIVVGDTVMIEDKHGDSIGYIRFPITSSLDYEAISIFYKITGAVPYQIKESTDADCVIHLVRLRNLPSLTPMGRTTAPTYTVEFQTDSFEWGISRMVIRDNERRCVVRYERSSDSGWITYANDNKPRLRYYTD
jgi:hypothetical protein